MCGEGVVDGARFAVAEKLHLRPTLLGLHRQQLIDTLQRSAIISPNFLTLAELWHQRGFEIAWQIWHRRTAVVMRASFNQWSRDCTRMHDNTPRAP